MPPAGWLTLAVITAMTVLVARERVGPDLAMFGALSILTIGGIITPDAALLGFANPAVVTIGSLFVVAAAVQETGGIHLISRWVLGTTKSPTFGLVRMTLPIAALSAFVNNTPVVAMFIPVASDFARRLQQSPSQYLIPLSFASLLGGTCTLVGTSPNLVISGLLDTRGLEPLGVFEISWVGVPTALFGLLYLLTVGQFLLKRRKPPLAQMHEEPREYLAEVEVALDSPLIGRNVEEAGLRSLPGLFLASIRRADGTEVQPVAPQDRLVSGDHLVFSGLASTVADLQQLPGLVPADLPDARGHELRLFEVVVSHRSPLIGQTVRDANFRRRYSAAILGVHRSGIRIQQKIGDIRLRSGDTLMLSASPGFHRVWRDSGDFYLVSEVEGASPPRYRRAPLGLAILAGLVLIPAITSAPMMLVAMGAVVAVLATGCIEARRARRAIDWSVLMIIASALGLAQALETSGAAAAIAQGLLVLTQPLHPVCTLAGIYVIAAASASFISNAAAAALVFPIAVAAANGLGLDPRPFAIAVAMAASAGFSTPIGSNPNLLVYGPGGYRYLDFTRVGLPLNALCLVVVLVVLPWVWPLEVAP